MAAAALEGVTIHDDDVVFVGDTLYHEARLGIYSRRPGKDMAARPTYELRWQTGRAGSSSAAVSQPSFMWYRDGWHVGDEKDLGLLTSHFFLRDAATRPDLTTSMKPWQAALDGGWEDVPGVHCLAGAAGRAALVMHEEELDRRLARAASTVFLVGTPPRGGARGLGTYERRPSDLNRRPTYVLREPLAPGDQAGTWCLWWHDQQWVAGPESGYGTKSGYLYCPDAARCPEQAVGVWQAYVYALASGRQWAWVASPNTRCLSLDASAPPGALGQAGQLSLHWACEIGAATYVKRLVEAKAEPDRVEKDSRTGTPLALPLVVACLKGHLDCATLLLDARASVDLCGRDGTSPLIAAAKGGQPECVELLLRHGASLSLRANGKTALEHSAAVSRSLDRVARSVLRLSTAAAASAPIAN